MTTNLTTRRRSATTIVAAIGAIGAAAAVAGMATFGDFTDSTTPVNTRVDTGVVSINLSHVGDSGSVPFAGGMMLAGDARSHLVDLVNDGTTSLSEVSLKSWATSSSILDRDAVNGLRLKVESCSVAWDASGASPVCAGTVRTYANGPIIVADIPLGGTAVLAPGAVDHLKLTASLPVSATSDDFQGATSSLSFQFTATQKTGSAR